MKKILLGTVALAALGLAAPAVAADLPAKAPMYAKAPAMVAVYNWTGFYVGAHAGYSWGTTGYDLVGGPVSGTNYNIAGGLIGAHLGYNYQMGNFVIGIEGDWDWNNLRGNDGNFGGVVDGTEGRWQASIRGRLGFAASNWLIYGTGGWSWLNANVTKDVPSFSANATRGGWTLGAGAEYAFNSNWIARAEYRFASYNPTFYDFAAGFDRNARRTDTHSAIVGISYKFGGPVVAKY